MMAWRCFFLGGFWFGVWVFLSWGEKASRQEPSAILVLPSAREGLVLKGTNQPKACTWKAPTDRPAAMIDPTPTVLPIPMSHTEAQTFLHRQPPRVLQAGPCPSSHMSGNGRSESVVHILHKAPTHRGKIARCRARSNKRTNQTTSWKPRNGRKRIPAPLGIWGGGGGSEDYPKAGKGGQGGARGEEDGRGRG